MDNSKSNIPPWDENELAYRRQAVLRFSWVALISWVCVLITELYWGRGPLNLHVLVGLFSNGLALYVMYKHNFLLGRLMLISMSGMSIFYGNLYTHDAGNIHHYYIVILGGAFLAFSYKTERKYLILTLVFTGLLTWLGMKYGGGRLIPLKIDEASAIKYDAAAAHTLVPIVLVFELSFLAYFNDRHRKFLEEAWGQATRANEAKGRFLANVSHEIRTPMNGILGVTELLKRTELTPQQQRMAKTIEGSSTALLRIIDDIIDSSRIDAGKLEIHNAPLHLLDEIEHAIEILRPLAQNANVNIKLHFDPDLPEWIIGDAGRLRQIILNIAGNAIKFTARSHNDEAGMMVMRVEKMQNNRMSLTFEDNGVGMSTETLAKIFQPFSQSDDAATRKFGGAGLGLSITKMLVDRMGGDIHVKSVLNEGTTMVVVLNTKEADGPTRIPKIDPMHGLMWGNYEGINHAVTIYSKQLGVTIDKAQSLEEFEKMLQDKTDYQLVIVAPKTMDEMMATRDIIKAKNLCQKTIFLYQSIKMATMEGQDCASMVSLSPLCPSDLWSSIALLARSSGIKVDEHPTIKAEAQQNKSDLTVLIVEDNLVNQQVMEAQLSTLGYKTKLAENGVAGIEAWRNGGVDLILSDCHMPEMDGLEMSRRIRAEEAECKHIPIIAITANALVGEAEKCIASGMDDHLSKPVKLTDLEDTLGKWSVIISRGAPASGASIEELITSRA